MIERKQIEKIYNFTDGFDLPEAELVEVRVEQFPSYDQVSR